SVAGWVGAFGAPFTEAAVAGLGAGSGKRRRGWKMPVHSRGDKKETNHHDEMEVDYAENEGSSSEDEDTESSSVSEDGDSSEMDDEDCERRRMECLDEMSNLEKQFTDLKDQLYKERLSQVDAKLQEVIAGKAPEYLEPLATLQENMQIRTKVAGIYRELCLESVKNKYECEIQASRQHCESCGTTSFSHGKRGRIRSAPTRRSRSLSQVHI
ncbi:mCG22342, isoform CRA_b, partial [Mus musculus]